MSGSTLRPNSSPNISQSQRPSNRMQTLDRIKYATGDCPPFDSEDLGPMISDSFNKRIYMFPDDKSDTPEVTHLYCCDLTRMAWLELTDRLTHRNPYDAFSEEEREPQKKRLPLITRQGLALLRIGNSSFIVMFGGYNHTTKKPSADIIIIDLKNLGWWTLRLERRNDVNVSPRVWPVVATAANKVYIFGGYRELGDTPTPHTSYSVAEYVPERGIWRWAVQDMPYPATVPSGYKIRNACTVYGGSKILLTPSRLAFGDPIHFTKYNMLFYDTLDGTFQPATENFGGNFPQDVSWYMLRTPHVPPAQAAPAAATHTTSPAPAPVFICVWIPVLNTADVALEIWRLSFVKKRIDCLHVSRKVWDLDTKLEECVFVDVGGAPVIRALGTKGVGSAGRKRKRGRDTPDESSSDEDDGATWNVYFDIPLLGL